MNILFYQKLRLNIVKAEGQMDKYFSLIKIPKQIKCQVKKIMSCSRKRSTGKILLTSDNDS